MNPNPNTDGLRPWHAGESGNPSGRAKRSRITDHLMEQLDSPIPPEMILQIPENMRDMFGEKPTFGQFAAFKLLSVAIGKGDVFAFKEILDRVEGKVAQKVTDGEGGPLQFILTRPKRPER